MKVIDPTGVELSPGEREKCLGNGEHVDDKGLVIECCCDECDYLLICFPEFDPRNKEQTADTDNDPEDHSEA